MIAGNISTESIDYCSSEIGKIVQLILGAFEDEQVKNCTTYLCLYEGSFFELEYSNEDRCNYDLDNILTHLDNCYATCDQDGVLKIVAKYEAMYPACTPSNFFEADVLYAEVYVK